MSDKHIKLITTFFYCGYFPFAPGTFASAVTVVLCLLLHKSSLLYALVLAAVIYLGLRTCDRMEQIEEEKDPSCVVIDEVAGMMISFLFLPFTPFVAVSGFFVFRFFDIFKIYPIDKLENIGGGKGIMYDDIMAGVYTNLVLQVAVRVFGII